MKFKISSFLSFRILHFHYYWHFLNFSNIIILNWKKMLHSTQDEFCAQESLAVNHHSIKLLQNVLLAIKQRSDFTKFQKLSFYFCSGILSCYWIVEHVLFNLWICVWNFFRTPSHKKIDISVFVFISPLTDYSQYRTISAFVT